MAVSGNPELCRIRSSDYCETTDILAHFIVKF